MKTLKKQLWIFTFIIIALVACKKDNNDVTKPVKPTNEEEVITTFKLYFTDSANSANTATAIFRDPDGDGGNSYTQFDSIILDAGKTYYTDVVILNETTSPADSISNEVKKEANEHLLVYTPSGIAINVIITDTDTNNPPLPLGLKSKWRTGATDKGTIRIQLRHQPGVKDGTATPGANDIDLTFNTRLK